MPSIFKSIFLFSLLLFFSACEIQPVKPWQRGTLAKPEMQLVADELENFLDEHIYFSKEAATGGQGVGGGGCGCN